MSIIRPYSKASKLAIIKSVLSGTYHSDKLQAPQHYLIIFNQDEDEFDYQGLKMNKDEFEQWKVEHLRAIDSLFLFPERFSREPEPSELQLPPAIEYPKPARTPIEDFTAREQTVIVARDIISKKKPETKEPVYVEAEEVPHSGKLSEYGGTWRFSNEFIQASKTA